MAPWGHTNPPPVPLELVEPPVPLLVEPPVPLLVEPPVPLLEPPVPLLEPPVPLLEPPSPLLESPVVSVALQARVEVKRAKIARRRIP
jgi:hypothetical protein